MKKFIFSITVILLTVIIAKSIYISKKCIDINYAVENYFTTGIFNKYKIYNIENSTLSFSNGKDAFMKIKGISSKTPHQKVEYTVFLEKNTNGIWKIKKVYSAEVPSQ
ncbi:hypothetical protein [Clostridium sp.]|jgi:hypothetical protein|uniref:hypothetical protein n=1 Tax=Clostridium sp. TaxID=1506 RepID=UPI002FDE33DB